jgi:hypothetical protein
MKLRQFAIALGLTLGAIACAESLARAHLSASSSWALSYLSQPTAEAPAPAEIIQTLANSTLSGRELDNRYTISNIAKLARHPQPQTITTAFLGTSRTKLLNPELIGWQNAVISAGNSYNEISYSYLIEAAFLKEEFPNLKYLFVETSLLNRQEPSPAFIMASDHRKYLPFLVSLEKELSATPSAKGIAQLLAQQKEQSSGFFSQGQLSGQLSSELFKQKDQFKLSTLLGVNETQQKMPVSETELFKQLNENGVQNEAFSRDVPANEQARLTSPEVQADDPKITRLVDIKSRYPWDEQFTALADWAKVKGVTLVFFQPPVRSDFYAFQEQYGLEMHRQDIAELAKDRGFPFVDLNARSLHYANDWSLFSDADHLGSCKGRYVYATALQMGFERWQSQGELLPTVDLQEAVNATEQLKTACSLAE